jgi:hypothetical protein
MHLRSLILFLFVLTPLAASAQSTDAHPFFSRSNIALFSADGLVRALDAESTRANLENPCRCYVEQHTPAISARTSTQYAYSLGVTGGIVGLSYVAHRLGYHRVERILPLIDIGYDAPAVIRNYAISGRSRLK